MSTDDRRELAPQEGFESRQPGPSRRRLLGFALSAGFFGLLAGAYGTLAAFMGRFLLPPPPDDSWTYVAHSSSLSPGKALNFTTPTGATVNVVRQGEDDASIIALSSTCPHLGCQVYWQTQQDRFFCPCHNGVFDKSGTALSGPPAKAGQDLPQYPVEVRGGLVFIALPAAQLAADRH